MRSVPRWIRSFVALPLCLVVALLAGLSIAGCDDPPNTQRLPIGQRCGDDSSCGTSPYVCETVGHPGGYCDKICATDADCPTDSVCVALHCRRTCPSADLCRTTEGYICKTAGATAPYCDVP